MSQLAIIPVADLNPESGERRFSCYARAVSSNNFDIGNCGISLRVPLSHDTLTNSRVDAHDHQHAQRLSIKSCIRIPCHFRRESRDREPNGARPFVPADAHGQPLNAPLALGAPQVLAPESAGHTRAPTGVVVMSHPVSR